MKTSFFAALGCEDPTEVAIIAAISDDEFVGALQGLRYRWDGSPSLRTPDPLR